MIIDEEAYLEHFGVKGMRWGVRNEKDVARRKANRARAKAIRAGRKINKYGSSSAPLTAAQRKARKERNGTRLKLGAAAALYGLYVYGNYKLLKGGPFPHDARLGGEGYARQARSTARGAKSAADIIEAERATQIASLVRTKREGHINREQLDNFKTILNRRYDRRVAEALR